jgi:hypothetical protein
LRIVGRIVRAAAVTDSDVEVAITAERQHPAVVIRCTGVGNYQDPPFSRSRDIRSRRRREILSHDERTNRILRVEDEQPAIRAVKRMERKTEQATLASREHS